MHTMIECAGSNVYHRSGQCHDSQDEEGGGRGDVDTKAMVLPMTSRRAVWETQFIAL